MRESGALAALVRKNGAKRAQTGENRWKQGEVKDNWGNLLLAFKTLSRGNAGLSGFVCANVCKVNGPYLCAGTAVRLPSRCIESPNSAADV